jgi:hypothetical protein
MAERRGMLIKNVSEEALEIRLDERTLAMEPGEEVVVAATEVRQPAMRANLQVRTIAIVRPSTDEEAAALAAAS